MYRIRKTSLQAIQKFFPVSYTQQTIYRFRRQQKTTDQQKKGPRLQRCQTRGRLPYQPFRTNDNPSRPAIIGAEQGSITANLKTPYLGCLVPGIWDSCMQCGETCIETPAVERTLLFILHARLLSCCTETPSCASLWSNSKRTRYSASGITHVGVTHAPVFDVKPLGFICEYNTDLPSDRIMSEYYRRSVGHSSRNIQDCVSHVLARGGEIDWDDVSRRLQVAHKRLRGGNTGTCGNIPNGWCTAVFLLPTMLVYKKFE